MHTSKTLRTRIDNERLNCWTLGLDAEELFDHQLVAIERGIGVFSLDGHDVVSLPLHAFERQARFN